MMVDVRSPDEFTGKLLAPPHLPQEQPQVPGHIPGATKIPWSKAANRVGSSTNHRIDLRALYEGAKIMPLAGEGGLVLYRMEQTVLAHLVWCRRAARLPDVRDYDGSWTE